MVIDLEEIASDIVRRKRIDNELCRSCALQNEDVPALIAEIERLRAELLCVQSGRARAQGYAAGLESGIDRLKDALQKAQADRAHWRTEAERYQAALDDVQCRLYGGSD